MNRPINVGDIVRTVDGSLWRVTDTSSDTVHGDNVETGRHARLNTATVRVIEPHPGGRK